MTPESYQQLMDLFDRSADLPASEKAAFLEDVRSNSPQLAGELSRMLRLDKAGSASIREAIQSVALPLVSETDPGTVWTGKRIGPYVVEREVGRGGMGVVFEAFRADDEYRKRVALKIATRSAFSEDFRQRFRHERQILAGLEHPNIARLLDGGTTPDGMPYFAMEFVEGLPIHRYCEQHKLSIPRRLELFLEACDAVEYAHQHLVVHRDIKPANILVDAKGVPKLLDFGIAKLLDAGGAGSGVMTQTAFAPVTPDYCSPEQVVGERITTRTDVYLLGLLLFELLSGERAQKADTSSPGALERSIRSTEIPAASSTAAARSDPSLARALRGDLDMIVATATRKEPERRFAGVAAMADEIRLHLQGRPITSRPEGVWYRAAKFVRRNALASAAAAGFSIALIGGVAATTYQAQRAAHRFDQVRGLAKSMMFDIHDSIKVLPGSVDAQNKVVETALRYLDTLSTEASGDERLQVELAAGYTRIAGIQGNDLTPSLGNRDRAKESLHKALAIVSPVLKSDPGNEVAVVVLVDANITLSDILARAGESGQARKLIEASIAAAERAAAKPGAGLDVQRRYAMARMTMVRDFGEGEAGTALAGRMIEALAPLEKAAGQNPDVLGETAIGYSVAAGAYIRDGQEPVAVPLLEKAVALQDRLVSVNPQNVTSRRASMLAHAKLGDALVSRGAAQLNRRADGLAHYAKMAEQAEWLYKGDPKRKANRVDYAMSLLRFSDAKPVEDATAIDGMRSSMTMLASVAADDPKDSAVRRLWSEAAMRCGARHIRRRELHLARPYLVDAVKAGELLVTAEPTRPANVSTLMRSYMELGNLHAQLNERSEMQRVKARVEAIAPKDARERVEKWKASLSSPKASAN